MDTAQGKDQTTDNIIIVNEQPIIENSESSLTTQIVSGVLILIIAGAILCVIKGWLRGNNKNHGDK